MNLRTPVNLSNISSEEIYHNKHCLSTGINAYNDWPRLAYAVHDATEVARILRENYGFKSSILIDTDATKGKIQEKIVDDLAGELKEDDLLVVFFAGHGHTEHLADRKRSEEHTSELQSRQY